MFLHIFRLIHDKIQTTSNTCLSPLTTTQISDGLPEGGGTSPLYYEASKYIQGFNLRGLFEFLKAGITSNLIRFTLKWTFNQQILRWLKVHLVNKAVVNDTAEPQIHTYLSLRIYSFPLVNIHSAVVVGDVSDHAKR